MKYLTIENEDVVYLTTCNLGLEGILDFITGGEKEKAPNTFNIIEAFDKVKQYSKNPKDFVINTNSPAVKRLNLCLSVNGAAPKTIGELAVNLEITVKKASTVVSKLEKDRFRQASILSGPIVAFNYNIENNVLSTGKVRKPIAREEMMTLLRAADKAFDSYYQFVGKSVQKDAESWLGGSPFKLKLKPENGRYRNAGGGKLKSVSNLPLPDQAGLDKLVAIFLRLANRQTKTFNESAFDDRKLKNYVDYKLNPDVKSMVGSLTSEQRQGLAVVFSGKSNSQELQLELCVAMKSLYASVLIYLDKCITKAK